MLVLVLANVYNVPKMIAASISEELVKSTVETQTG